MVEPGTAISVSVRFGRLFLTCVWNHLIIFAGIELNCVARPVESDLPINTMSEGLDGGISIND